MNKSYEVSDDKLVQDFRLEMSYALDEAKYTKNDVLIDDLDAMISGKCSPEQARRVISDAINLYAKAKNIDQADAVNYFTDIFAKKQHDYGPNNIAHFGEIGLIVRLTDKLERLKNFAKKDRSMQNESILDTYLDIANYCTILLLVIFNKWSVPCKHYVLAEVSEVEEV